MKKIAVGVVLMTFLAVGASAQDKQKEHQGKHKGKQHREFVTKDLNLSDDQKQKMKGINETFKKQMSELRNNENITVKEMRDRRSAIAKEHRSAIQGLLTQEQKNKLQEHKAKSIEKRKEMQVKRMEKMKKDLALTDDQSAKLKSMNESYRSKFETLRKNESLDRSAKQEQMKTLREQQKSELKNVLTEEQIQKLEEMKKNHHRGKEAK